MDEGNDIRPRVSVVVPVYNKAPYLQECLDSVYSQTYPDFELIAVDDRSTDESLSILQGQRDPRLKVVALEKNLGPAGAAQRAMDLASGEYIVRMDADDMMYSDRIAQQVAFMDAHPHIGASSGQVTLFGQEDSVWTNPLDPVECQVELLFGVPVAQGGSILRTQVLREHSVRYQDHWPRIGEDWLFWVELGRHTQFANLDRPILYYRRGEQNISHGKDLSALRKGRVELVLRSFGLEPTEREVEMHLLAKRSFLRRPDRRTIRDYREWLNKLKAWNRSTGSFPEKPFQQRLQRAWDQLFHQLPQRNIRAALEHLRYSDGFRVDRLIYIIKCTLKSAVSRAQGSAAPVT